MSRKVVYTLDKYGESEYSKIGITGVRNKENGTSGLVVSHHGLKTTFTGVYENEDIDEDIITPSNGNALVVTDVYLYTDGNIGEVAVDFSDGDPIARLYSSQFSRTSLRSLSIDGDVDESIQLTADVTDRKLLVVIAYVEV